MRIVGHTCSYGPEAERCAAAPLQLGDNSMMQAVLKMGDGVSNTPSRPVPRELQHPHSKVRVQDFRLR
jgi:hypothetical protein